MAKVVKERPLQAVLDDKGREILDPVPMAPPLGYKRQPTLTERIRDMVRSEHVRLAALQAGAETFEEADDFEVGDDYEELPRSLYEEVFDPVDADARMKLRDDDYRASVEARSRELRPVKENDDGSTGTDEGRSGDPVRGSGHSDKELKGKSKSKQNATNERSVANADRGDREVEE